MSAAKRMNCPGCRKRIDTGEAYCGYCGMSNPHYDKSAHRANGKAEERERRKARIVLLILVILITAAAWWFLIKPGAIRF